MIKSRVFRIVLVFVFAFAMFFGVLASWVVAEDGPNYNVVFLIDSSESITNPGGNTDPDDKRIRFSRFLVRYMQAFYPDRSQVGVIRFYSDVDDKDVIVPLTFVSKWTAADFYAVSKADERKPGTNFINAMEKGREALVDKGLECSTNGTTGDVCHLVIFTDGQIMSGQAETIKDMLRSLRENYGIRVTTVLFQGDPADEKTWEAEAEVVNADVDIQVVYEGILQALMMDEPLTHFEEPLVFTETAILPPVPVSPFHRIISVTLLTDGFIEESWTPRTTIDAGLERWWIDPTQEEIQGTFSTTSPTLLYYTYDEEFYKVKLNAVVVPNRVAVGTPVKFLSWANVGGQILTETDPISVQVDLNPGDHSLFLKSVNDGMFTGVMTSTRPGTYTVKFTPQISSSSDLTVNRQKLALFVGDVPELKLSAGPNLTDTGDRIILPATITVEGYDTIANLYTPTLQIEANGREYPSHLSHNGNGVFVDSVEMSSPVKIILRAWLPGGFTHHKIPFSYTMIEKALVFGRHEYRWTVGMKIFLILIAAIVVLVIVVAILWERKRKSTFPLSNLKQELSKTSADKDSIAKQFEDSDYFTLSWQKFARRVSKLIVRTHSESE